MNGANRYGKILAIGVVCGLAASALATDVPKGGAVIDLGAGGSSVEIDLKNKTGEDAEDITIVAFRDDGLAPPNITGVDITKNGGEAEGDDVFDDDGDNMEDAGETNTTDDDGTSTNLGKSMIKKGKNPIKKDATADVNVEFDRPLREGDKVRVKFSNQGADDKHRDLCAIAPVDPSGMGWAEQTLGSSAWQTGVLNQSGQVLDGFIMIGSPMFPFQQVHLPPQYAGSDIILQGELAFVDLKPDVAPNSFFDVFVDVELPLLHQRFEYPLIVQGVLKPCIADFNRDGTVNTQDVLAYLNAWAVRDPRADINGDGTVNTLDFIQFLNLWTAGCR